MLLEKQYRIIYPDMAEQKTKKKRSYKQFSKQTMDQFEENQLRMSLKKSKYMQDFQNQKIVGLFKMEKPLNSHNESLDDEPLLEITEYKDIDALYYMPNWKKKQAKTKGSEILKYNLGCQNWEDSSWLTSYNHSDSLDKDFNYIKKEAKENNPNKMLEEFLPENFWNNGSLNEV